MIKNKKTIMNKNNAKKLAKYHKFTKIELYDMLVEALATFSDEYWKKPSKINPIFDNGYHFNSCREWIGYEKGVNEDEFNDNSIVFRVLESFGKFSKIQLPKKIKHTIQIQASAKPTL